MRVWLLSGFRVKVGCSRTIEESTWRLRKAAAPVKLLALAPGHRPHREEVMQLLWPELGAKAAANNLLQVLHAACKILTPDPTVGSCYLALQRDHIALCPGENLWVDVEEFGKVVLSARRSREPDAYEAATDLYVGELLPQDRYEERAEDRRRDLRQTYLSPYGALICPGRARELRCGHRGAAKGHKGRAFRRGTPPELDAPACPLSDTLLRQEENRSLSPP